VATRTVPTVGERGSVPRLDETAAGRVASARVGRLATVDAAGTPHLVPVTFVLVGGSEADVVHSAVDDKPKSGRPLRRLANVEETGRACLLVDHYAEDWDALWWVRLDLDASVLPPDAPGAAAAVDALAAKYPQYAERRPAGPVLRLEVTGWRAWSAR
jgi:PPOX class probable F420-dependent enzyme